MTEIALKARTSVATKKVTSTAPKKTRKKFKTTTWRFANGVKVVRESVRNFRTYQGSTKGGVIAFSKDAAANVFAGELDHRTDTKLFGKASRPVYSWVIDHRSRIEDPVFQDNRLPVRIHLVGNVTLVRPTFISTHDSVCRITVEAASNRLKLVEAEFKGDSSLVSMTHRTQTGIRLHDARLRLSRDVDVDYSLFDDVLFHVPEEGQMNHAIVRDGMKPMFFVGVGDEGGTMTTWVNSRGEIRVSRGCFSGTPEQFLAAVKEKRSTNFWYSNYPKLMAVAKAFFRTPAKNIAAALKEEQKASDL